MPSSIIPIQPLDQFPTERKREVKTNPKARKKKITCKRCVLSKPNAAVARDLGPRFYLSRLKCFDEKNPSLLFDSNRSSEMERTIENCDHTGGVMGESLPRDEDGTQRGEGRWWVWGWLPSGKAPIPLPVFPSTLRPEIRTKGSSKPFIHWLLAVNYMKLR